MRRSEALQGVRIVRFRSVLKRYEPDEINQVEAAEMPGVSERTFRRWCRRFDGEGGAGLVDRRLGRASPKRMPADDEAEIERLYRTRYQGFTAVHFHEHLTRDHLHRWSYTRVKRLLQEKGLLGKAPKRGVHRRKRPRRPMAGMMLRHRKAIRRRQARQRRARRLAPRVACGPAGAGPDRDDGRRDERDLLGVPDRRGRHGFDVSGAC
jgi:transposase